MRHDEYLDAQDLLDSDFSPAAQESVQQDATPVQKGSQPPQAPVQVDGPNLAAIQMEKPRPPISIPRIRSTVSHDASRMAAMGAGILGHDPGQAYNSAEEAQNNSDMSPYRNREELLNNARKQREFENRETDQDLSRQDRNQQRAQLVAQFDATSPISRAAQERFKSKLGTYGSMPGIYGGLAKQMAQDAERSDSMNAAQVAALDADYEKRLGTVSKFSDLDAKQALARQNAGLNERKTAAAELQARNTGTNMWADNAHQDRQLNETIRHNQAQEANGQAAANKHDLTIRKTAQEKLNQEIGDLTNAEKLMSQLEDIKKSVNTGPIAGPIQNLASKIDMAPDKYVQMKALGARVFNRETKSLAGVAVSPSEWARIAPMIPDTIDDDKTYERKLKVALDATRQLLTERRKQYQMIGNTDKTMDQSVTAQENNPRNPVAPKAHPQDSEAVQWAKSHPDDPRAAKILEMNQ